jgi:hypothetical protein
VAAVATLLGAACGGGGGDALERGSDTPAPTSEPPGSAPVPTAEAEAQYGIAPEPNPDVTYAPDVVMVGGGAAVVRSVADDGLTWQIDPDAPRADELEVGGVMFLTGRAVGRVLALEEKDGDLAVTLGPVDITEVISDGTFTADEPIPLDGDTISISAGEPFWSEYDVDEPGDEVPGSEGVPTLPPRRVPGIRPASSEPIAPSGPSGAAQPVSSTSRRAGAIGGFGVTPTCCAKGVGAQFTYDANGIRLFGAVALTMQKPSAKFHLEIHGSKVTRAELQIEGGAGLRIEIEGATNTGNNLNKRLVIPVDFSVPIGQVLGVPFAVTVNQMVGVQTAFSSKDGNIKAAGEWSFNRSIGFGYANGAFGVQAPDTLAVKSSIVDSISGISVGVTGVIVNYQARFNVGLGAFGFTAGLYFVVTTTAGVTVGSAAGSPIEVCRSAQVGLWANYGVGFTIPEHLVKVINSFLDLLNARPIPQSGGIGEVKNVFNRYVVFPDVPICRG